MLSRSEDRIDVGEAALIFERLTQPQISVADYVQKIDALAEKVKTLNQQQGGKSWLWSIDQVLKREGYHYDFSPDYKTHQRNHTLNGLLDTKQGFCDSMTALYIAIAQRVGLRPYPVLAPSHIFVRYTGLGLRGILARATGITMLGGETLNIDPTSGGTQTDDGYIKQFHITENSIKSGAYMRPLSYREYLGFFMLQAGQDMMRSEDANMRANSKAYFDKATELNPRDPFIAEVLRRQYSNQSLEADREGNAQLAAAYHTAALGFQKRAEELGYIKGEEE